VSADDPKVRAVSFEQRVVEVRPGRLGPVPATITAAELSNGRTLLIDDWGVVDQHDLDTERPEGEARQLYLSWDALLAALDAQRQSGLN